MPRSSDVVAGHVVKCMRNIKAEMMLRSSDEIVVALGMFRLQDQSELDELEKAMTAADITFSYRDRRDGFFGTGAIVIVRKPPAKSLPEDLPDASE